MSDEQKEKLIKEINTYRWRWYILAIISSIPGLSLILYLIYSSIPLSRIEISRIENVGIVIGGIVMILSAISFLISMRRYYYLTRIQGKLRRSDATN